MDAFLAAADYSAVTISIQGVPTAQGAIVQYITLPANDPKTFGNHIYVWQTTDSVVPWNKPPIGDTAIASSSSTSTQMVNFAFEEKGYIIGYAVAPTPMAVCSTIYMPVGKQTDPTAWLYNHLSLQVVYVGTNLVQVKYTGLPQYLPATNKNWIGLWQGSQVPYDGAPISQLTIQQDAPSTGYATLQGMQLLIGFSYSVGYFMVEPTSGRRSLAASASFTVGA